MAKDSALESNIVANEIKNYNNKFVYCGTRNSSL